MSPRVAGRLTQVLVLGVAVTTIACDQASKHLARALLVGEPRHSYWGDTVRLEYVENPGAFLGLGSTLPATVRKTLFTAGSAILLFAMAGAGLRRGWTLAQRLGIGLAWAGGLSNLVDRLLRDRVSDFLNVGVGGLRTGIFNVADVAIMLGVVLVAGERLWPGRRGLE